MMQQRMLGQVRLVSRPSLGQHESECGKYKAYMDAAAKAIADNNAAAQAAAAAGDQAGVDAAFKNSAGLQRTWEHEKSWYDLCVKKGFLWVENPALAFTEQTTGSCPSIPTSPGTSPGLKGSQWFGKRFFE